MKWDGHTHSQFCRHGKGEETARMVERAIELGFERYSVVEHAPLPDGIINDTETRLDFGLMWDELDDYFSHLSELKKLYGDQIQLMSGLELDFFEGLEDFTREILMAYSDQLDDVILSLHFIKGSEGFKPLDYAPEVFKSELLDYYNSIDNVQEAYWENVRRMVEADLVLPPTKRLGHLGLINKYADLFGPGSPHFNSKVFFEQLMKKIKLNGWALDFNVAGLVQKWYQDVYLTEPMRYWTHELKIATVYGSDAHTVLNVGQFYDTYVDLCHPSKSNC